MRLDRVSQGVAGAFMALCPSKAVRTTWQTQGCILADEHKAMEKHEFLIAAMPWMVYNCNCSRSPLAKENDMRLWHKDLISVLPRQQLLGQWRELCVIMSNIAKKGTPNHMLVNKVMDYDPREFFAYANAVKMEMER